VKVTDRLCADPADRTVVAGGVKTNVPGTVVIAVSLVPWKRCPRLAAR
jgi:hypothetical protein